MNEHLPRQVYAALSDSVFALYEAGQQRTALSLLDDADPGLSQWRSELAHLRACLHGSLGEPAAAMSTLAEAHAAGGWWDPEILVEDDDLSPLTDMPEFAALVDSSTARWTQANAEPDRSGDRFAMPSGRARGVVVALHGAEEDADDAIAAWGSATGLGFAVLAVRSSQRTSPCYRSWPDQQRAAAEIADALQELPVDVRDLPAVAAGFSAGGRVALHWALTSEPCAVAGVVAVAPAVRDLAPSRHASLDPALLVVGSADELRDDVVVAGEALVVSGFRTDVVEGLEHRFPEDFAVRLAAALAHLR